MKSVSLSLVFVLLTALVIPPPLQGDYYQNRINQGLQLSRNKPLQAIKVFRDIIKRRPAWDYPHILLADIYDRNFLINEAIKEFRTALRLGNRSQFMVAKLNYKLGNLHARAGRLDQAEKYFRKAHSINKYDKQVSKALRAFSFYKTAMTTYQASMKKKQHVEQTIRNLDRALQLKQDWISCSVRMARLLERIGDVFAARRAFRYVLMFAPVYAVNVPGAFLKQSWNNIANPMTYKGNGVWEVRIKLKKGINEYKFVINKKRMIKDPDNPNVTGIFGNSFINCDTEGKTHIFRYRSLPLDDFFVETLKRLEMLTSREAYLANYKRTVAADDLVPVTFRFTCPHKVQSLYLAGTFNNFLVNVSDKEKYLMKKAGDKQYQITLNLPPGKYLYEFRSKNRARYIDWNAGDFFVDEKKYNEVFAARTVGGKTLNPNTLIPVEFHYKPSASLMSVHVAGTFNFWGGSLFSSGQYDKYALKMKWNHETKQYVAKTRLPSGIIYYKFVVNGRSWIIDPENRETMNDGMGGKNSVKVVMRHKIVFQKKEIRLRYIRGKNVDYVLNLNLFPRILHRGENGSYLLKKPEKISLMNYYSTGKNLYIAELIGHYANKSGTITWKMPFSFHPDKGKVRIRPVKPSGQPADSKRKNHKVVFKYKAPKARSVWVAGSFNHWGGTENGGPLNKKDCLVLQGPDKNGYWHGTTKLPEGRYEYKFIVDSQYWRHDPENSMFVYNFLGQKNSVTFVGKSAISTFNLTEKRLVRFRYHNPRAKSVWVAGVFNDWGGTLGGTLKKSRCLVLQGPDSKGYWNGSIKLPLGKYPYKFILDEEKWIRDPENPNFIPDKMGGFSSILMVGNQEVVSRISKQLVFPDNIAISSIYLVNQDSEWEILSGNRLKKTGRPGVYKLTIKHTRPGRIVYNYAIRTTYHGNLVLMDPSADDIIPNQIGGFNFVKMVY